MKLNAWLAEVLALELPNWLNNDDEVDVTVEATLPWPNKGGAEATDDTGFCWPNTNVELLEDVEAAGWEFCWPNTNSPEFDLVVAGAEFCCPNTNNPELTAVVAGVCPIPNTEELLLEAKNEGTSTCHKIPLSPVFLKLPHIYMWIIYYRIMRKNTTLFLHQIDGKKCKKGAIIMTGLNKMKKVKIMFVSTKFKKIRGYKPCILEQFLEQDAVVICQTTL